MRTHARKRRNSEFEKDLTELKSISNSYTWPKWKWLSSQRVAVCRLFWNALAFVLQRIDQYWLRKKLQLINVDKNDCWKVINLPAVNVNIDTATEVPEDLDEKKQ